MDISLDVGTAMLPHLPTNRIAIAESGLFTPEDLARWQNQERAASRLANP